MSKNKKVGVSASISEKSIKKQKEPKQKKLIKEEKEEMQRKLEEEQAIANSSILELISDKFDYSFQENFFTVGLDLTGCYLFADKGYSDEEIEGQKRALQAAMDLTNKQVSVCVVDRKSAFNFCSRKLLGKYVGKATKAREKVLSRDDLYEILEAYGIDNSSETFFYDFRKTDAFQTIKEIIENAGFPIDEEVINDVCIKKIENKKILVQMGIPDFLAGDVAHVVRTGDWEGIIATTQKPDFTVETDEPRSFRRKPTIEKAVSVVCLTLGIIGIIARVFPAVVFAIAIAVIFAYYASRVDESTVFLRFTVMVSFVLVAIMAFSIRQSDIKEFRGALKYFKYLLD